MRKGFVWLFMLTAAGAAVADLSSKVAWDIECQKPAAYALQLTAGESTEWIARYKVQNRPLSLTNATRVAFLFRASGSTNVPYELAGSVENATNGKIRISWPASNVVAAGQYDYRILVAGVSKANMRGYGTLTVDAGFGTVTGSAPPYVQLITSNSVMAMIDQSWDREIVDVIARGHATESSNTVHGGFMATIWTKATNAWDMAASAFGWGNHADAGYASTNSLGNYLPTAGGIMTGPIAFQEAAEYPYIMQSKGIALGQIPDAELQYPFLLLNEDYARLFQGFGSLNVSGHTLSFSYEDGPVPFNYALIKNGPNGSVIASNEFLFSDGKPVVTGPLAIVTNAVWRNPDWFQLSWTENPTNMPDSISYKTNLDQVVEHHGFNHTRYDRVAQISQQHSFFDLDFAVIPTNLATVSSNGYITHLADGVVTASVTAATFGRTNVLFMRTEGMAIDRYWGACAGTLRATVISNVAANVTNTSTATFSTYTPPTFIRNTNLWVKPAPVCIAAWNSRSGHLGGGILITPKHAITAIHASFRPQVGDAVTYVDETNGVWLTSVAAEVNLAADIGLIRFTTNVPVRVAKFLADPDGILPTGIRELPLALGEVHFGTHEFQLVVGGSESWGQRGYFGISWWKAAEQTFWRALFKHFPVVGDSSQPVIFSTGRDFVALFALLSPTTGPNLHSYLTEIQATISGWGDTNTISYLDVTPYTEF